MVQNQTNQKLMKESRQKYRDYLKGLKKKDDDDPVDTDIDLDTNGIKNTELSTSASVTRQLTENTYDMVNT